jgi:hypothetical protein
MLRQRTLFRTAMLSTHVPAIELFSMFVHRISVQTLLSFSSSLVMRTLDNYQLERRIGLWDDYLFSRLNFCDLSRPPVLVTEKATHRLAESRETQPILCFHL